MDSEFSLTDGMISKFIPAGAVARSVRRVRGETEEGKHTKVSCEKGKWKEDDGGDCQSAHNLVGFIANNLRRDSNVSLYARVREDDIYVEGVVDQVLRDRREHVERAKNISNNPSDSK